MMQYALYLRGFFILKNETKKETSLLKASLTGALISLIISICAIFVFSYILYRTSLPDKSSSVIVMIRSYLSVFLGALISVRIKKSRALVTGAVVGIIYFLVLFVFACILNGSLYIPSLSGLFLGLLLSILGSIAAAFSKR